MRFLSALIILVSISISLSATADVSTDEVLVTSEDIVIKDKALETQLLKVVKENGTLTSTRQVDSYMLAVLCEYPKKGMNVKPSCSLRKVKVRPASELPSSK